jgi:hypothetical protein
MAGFKVITEGATAPFQKPAGKGAPQMIDSTAQELASFLVPGTGVIGGRRAQAA